MSLIITRGYGTEVAQPGPQVEEPEMTAAIDLKPDMTSGDDLKPDMVSAEEQ